MHKFRFISVLITRKSNNIRVLSFHDPIYQYHIVFTFLSLDEVSLLGMLVDQVFVMLKPLQILPFTMII